MQRLEGKRIYLRGYEMTDKDVLLAGSNNLDTAKLTGTQATFTLDQIEVYILRNQAGDGRAAWVICTHEDKVVGEVVINEMDEANRNANIRIGLFDPQDFGKGYGTEAMRLAVDYGFKHLNLHRISLGVYDFNPRAVHVYEKIGFVREGVERDVLLWDGTFHSMIRMSILENEWTPLV